MLPLHVEAGGSINELLLQCSSHWFLSPICVILRQNNNKVTVMSNEKERQQIIQKLVSYAEQHLPKTQMAVMRPFIEKYYAYTSVDDLHYRSEQDLFGPVLSLWELMYRRNPGEYKRRIFNPQKDSDGWETSHTVLEFILDDQPFLVDTICTELNSKGLAVHFLVHLGGIKILRNARNEIIEVLPYDSKNEEAGKEAPIYLEIDRQTNPQVLEELGEVLDKVINDARIAVADWEKMQEEVRKTLVEIDEINPPINKAEIEESKTFLQWLLKDHFTFLGYREYERVGQGESLALRLVPETGLGVLRDTHNSKVLRYYNEIPDKAQKISLSKNLLLLAKTNTRSTVHGRRYTDFISVKRYNAQGEIIGERWFIGLYTRPVYSDSPRSIPVIRLKIAEILKRSKLPINGRGYKVLTHILETLPRDDLFQANVSELYDLSLAILQLHDRRCIRLFARKDIYNRFVSCLVYVPRDEFTMELVNRMQEILQQAFSALEISYTTLFPDSILARIHFTIRLDTKRKVHYDLDEIEKKLIEVGRSWRDSLHEKLNEHFGEEGGNQLFSRYGREFPISYQEVFPAAMAVFDIERIEKLSDKNDLELKLYRPESTTESSLHLRLFHLNQAIPLSEAIPILEKMGFRVIGEQPYEIKLKDKRVIWINDFNMVYSQGSEIMIEDKPEIFQEAFKKIWHGEAEHDGFNSLVLSAHLSWQEIVVLRGYAKYLKQIGFTFSQEYMETTLSRHSKVVRLLLQLFFERFDPQLQKGERTTEILSQLETQINAALDAVSNLDEDRILRMFLNLIKATVRTNYYQKDAQGNSKTYLSFKFNPHEIMNVPLPLPAHEIFIYAPSFEGVHLRAGKVARGGIRWSDRKEDFRREVLGLMKAQQVKNAVIVPAGAKGGFVPKNLPVDGSRDAIMEEAISCYKNFIRGLLDLTDNFHGSDIIPPKNTVCYDPPDPYLVVAADKGTATFSDFANQISSEYDFWLGDAFASGGSAGYDHKKMGITARGAWESVKRHFQEGAIDINQPFTVVGIGDMSGDVFGNGMLQSEFIKLVAAFNGTHIFIDPNPDPAKSFAERQRLFNLPRSTWEDYDSKLISAGGGVFKRSLKTIQLTPQIKKCFNLEKDQLSPNELIQALLKASVDLLWNGGIGTYVKASTETNLDAGDRTNDAVRVNGNELTCLVVAEGGNLGLTQLARIEYEFIGGRINTDFIDNSGGVDCSDHEVNIKILLNNLVVKNEMSLSSRNHLLVQMTDEVAQLVLHDNYRQVRAIGIAKSQSLAYLDLYGRFLKEYAKQGKIDIRLEFLPDEEVFMARKGTGIGLSRPEIAVLLAYSKIILKAEIMESDLPNDPYLSHYMLYAFPKLLRSKYSAAMEQHRLRKEIIVTQLSNLLINDMGITFVFQMHDETGASSADIVRAYAISREIFNLDEYWKAINSLDVSIDVQTEMTLLVVQLIRRSTRWLLREWRSSLDVESTIALFLKGIKQLRKMLPKLFTVVEQAHFDRKVSEWIEAGVPEEIAAEIASVRTLSAALNIVQASLETGGEISKIAQIYFSLADCLGLDEFREMINNYPIDNRWMVLARSAVKGDLDWQQKALTVEVLKQDAGKSPAEQIQMWADKNQFLINRWQTVFTEIKSNPAYEYSMLVVAVRELLSLAQANL